VQDVAKQQQNLLRSLHNSELLPARFLACRLRYVLCAQLEYAAQR
jgi:hypothetical protein